MKLWCRKTKQAYEYEYGKPCPFCGAAIHGLDLSGLNEEIRRLTRPLPPRPET